MAGMAIEGQHEIFVVMELFSILTGGGNKIA